MARTHRVRAAITVLVSVAPLAAGGAPEPRVATLVAAGDVASCSWDGDETTASVVARFQGTVAVLGDAVYQRGTAEAFRDCYRPSWGRFLSRMRAALGNHEYDAHATAAPAKAALRIPATGWYSYELGAWHAVVLDSNCDRVGCERGSPQWRWLRDDLARHRASRCTLAYWHHPRFSSGARHGSDLRLAPFWDLLGAARADVVVSGHDHHYERFAPLKGIRSFVVGTGGAPLRPLGARHPASKAANDNTHGVLVLTLRPETYRWSFEPAAGTAFRDTGQGRCR